MPWEKQFDVDKALDKAIKAFWSKGYDATSTQDLLDCMGINRGSLYDTFGNKHALFLQALRRFQDDYQARQLAKAAHDRSPRQAIHALFQSLLADALTDKERCGCFLVNSALDMAPHDAEIENIVAQGFRQIETFLAELIVRGQESGEIERTVDPVDVSRALLGLMIAMRVLARSLPKKHVLESIVSEAMRMLE